MNSDTYRRRGAGHRPPTRLLALAILGLLALLGGGARPAQAHPAPSVIHDYLVVLGPGTARVLWRLSVAPQLVPAVYQHIDTDGDGVTSPAEYKAWVANYVARMQFTVDDQPAAFALTGASAADQHNLV